MPRGVLANVSAHARTLNPPPQKKTAIVVIADVVNVVIIVDVVVDVVIDVVVFIVVVVFVRGKQKFDDARTAHALHWDQNVKDF
jgi:hypothetical protein